MFIEPTGKDVTPICLDCKSPDFFTDTNGLACYPRVPGCSVPYEF